jgi:hypothetical protein
MYLNIDIPAIRRRVFVPIHSITSRADHDQWRELVNNPAKAQFTADVAAELVGRAHLLETSNRDVFRWRALVDLSRRTDAA